MRAVFAAVLILAAALVSAQTMPILTGAEIVGHGFDAKTARQGLFPILDWTYQFGNQWTSPVSGKTYSVPDQLNIASIPESATKIVESISYQFSAQWNEYLSWFKFSLGISEPGVFSAAVAYNKELHTIKAELSSDLNMQGFSQYWCTYYGLDMAPAYVLNPSDFFKLALEKLPASSEGEANKHLYQEFVQAYGTHYVCYGAFGGSVHLSQFLSKKIAGNYSLDQVAHQLSLGFSLYLFNISGGGFHNKSDIHLASWFAENAKTYMFFAGGAPAYQTNQTVGQWMQSIPDYAGLLNTTLCPLTDLVTWDATRQASLKSYIHEYLA
jgi:hypothetical protein